VLDQMIKKMKRQVMKKWNTRFLGAISKTPQKDPKKAFEDGYHKGYWEGVEDGVKAGVTALCEDQIYDV